MKRAILGSALGLAAISVAGIALAAGPQSDRVNRVMGGNAVIAQASPQTSPLQPQMQPGAPAAGASSGAGSAQPAGPPATIIGKDLVNSKGEKIGKVAKIDGDQVVVAVGGFLGIGAHDVAIPWKSLTTMGSGADLKVETAMTEDELKQLPQYENPDKEKSGIRAMRPGNGGFGGSTSSPTR